MVPRFDTFDDATGFEVVDPIETRRFTLSTPSAVEPTPADPDSFRFPVSSACTVVTSALTFPYAVLTYVWDADGDILSELAHDESAEFPPDEYLIELNVPVKLYLHVEAGVRVESETDSMRIEFDRETTVAVGARSFSETPAGTVTTTDDPVDAMAAVSTFGSALETTTCERSWPTLRGHPPLIERGDELSIPDGLDAPETGVTVAVPPEHEAVYAVAPLAYYFGAEVVPGETPRLTVGGFERRFDDGAGVEDWAGVEDGVVRTLEQAFFLDCATRTEGHYSVELADRNRLESLVDLDFADLYGMPLDEQLSAYFSIPYSTLADAMPAWHRIAYVRPDPENVETLPHLVNDLSILRTPPQPTYEETDEMRETQSAIDDFKRATPSDRGATRRPDEAGGTGWTDETDWVDQIDWTLETDRRRGVPPVEEYVDMPDVDAHELAWVGDGTPIRGTKVLPQAFRNETSDTSEDLIDVTVVCNDDEMREEWDAVAEVYAKRETFDFDLDVHFDVSTSELRTLLQTPTDLFHYIGHIDGRGFECPDGVFDAETLDGVEIEAFVLNACRSHDQGIALIDAGSRGGIVSLENVGNRTAVEFGETLAKLVHNGFSVGSALAIARKHTVVGTHYISLGDPGLTLAQSDDVIPLTYVVEDESADRMSLTIRGYPTRDHPIGSVSKSYLEDGPQFLSTGPHEVLSERERTKEVLADMPHTPLIIGGDLVLGREWVNDS
ncbi:CHAT domain-containing protein [Halorussus salinisoli]|uniref:hypothetical protein n=1 Tax=Halorussus salinisoli TaxID=2558242 RepID=UPI0010C2319C|nr:hypothetical protein [Halorussus salinisoli]